MSKKSFFSILCGLFLLTATQVKAQGTSWEEATLLTDGQDVSAAIETAGVEHWYKFTIDGKSVAEFIIQTDNVLKIGYMNLYATNGDVIESVRRNYVYFAYYTGTFRITDLSTGTYYLNVQRYSDYGSYTMSFNVTPRPKAEYSFIQNLNAISFVNESLYADSLTWNYGNGVSEFGNHRNPQYNYNMPGYYPVRLIAFNRVFNISDTVIHYVSVRGIQRVESDRGGNGGKVTISIIGGGMMAGSQAKLRRETTEIAALETHIINIGKMEATFDLAGATSGLYEVVVIDQYASEMSLANAFTVEEAVEPNVWTDIQGAQQFITGNTATYTVFYGNTGNIDAQSAILWVVTPDTPAEIEFLDLNFDYPNTYPNTYNWLKTDDIPYIVYENYYGDGRDVRLYGVKLPKIAAKSESTFNMRVKSDENYVISVFQTESFVDEDESPSIRMLKASEYGDFDECMAWAIGNAIIDMRNSSDANTECLKYGKKNEKNKRVTAIDSFDPTEMTGPTGFGAENYVAQKALPYSISFENKSTATSATPEVVIIDTLDTQKFDLSTFRFKEFGFGENRYRLFQDENKFVSNIDLRPAKNAILRVTGILEDSVVTWRFLTLDPRTMDLTKDIDAGFLPPNVESPEGEGFVSFVVSLNDAVGSGTVFNNFADIFFDANEPVRTNVFSNKIDETAPVSQVVTANYIASTQKIELTLSGTDPGGAGIKSYDLYVSTNGGDFVQTFKNIPGNTFSYLPSGAGRYSFYSIAIDSLSYRENAKSASEASLDYLAIKSVETDALRIYPNPVKNELFIDSDFPVTKTEVYTLTGALLLSESNAGNKLNVSALAQGVYMLKIYTDSGVMVKKLVKE